MFLKKRSFIPIGWSPDGKWICVSKQVTGAVEILMIALENGKEKTVLALPFTLEKGQPDNWLVSRAPDGKHFVFPVLKMHSDVWVIENFDPEMK